MKIYHLTVTNTFLVGKIKAVPGDKIIVSEYRNLKYTVLITHLNGQKTLVPFVNKEWLLNQTTYNI